jgi:hypothetical protein
LLTLGLSPYEIKESDGLAHVVKKQTLILYHKVVKHWFILLIGVVAFVVTLCVSQEPLTAAAIFRRIMDALGDVAFDRGITPDGD